MFRRMNDGVTREVTSIVDKVIEIRLRWFDYIMRWEKSEAVRMLVKMNVDGSRRRRRGDLIWVSVI